MLYDDAQSIYDRARSKQFSFKSVGIQAQGRTTILKINYRNTRQILHTASLVAADLLTADDKDDDGIPLLKPVSCGREGPAPLIIKLPTLRDEAFAIADHLASAHKEGHAWGDMAVLCADWKTMELCATALAQRKLPHRVRKKTGEYRPGADAIQVMTMKVSKGLEFPVVALPGVGHMPAAEEDEKEGDMAVLCRHYAEMEACSAALARKRLPHRVRKSSGDFRPLEDTIKVMTMHASKGLEFGGGGAWWREVRRIVG